MDIKFIKDRITKLCNQKNWSYYHLAKEAGFQQATLKPIIKEQNMPSLHTIEKICKAFNISISDFFDDNIFKEGTEQKELFISLWEELQPNDQEKVLIYMYGLLHKKIPREEETKLDL